MTEQRKRDSDRDKVGKLRREAFETREARWRTARIIRTFLGVVILAVLVGLGIVYRDQLLALLKQKPAPQVAVPVPKPPPVEKRVERPPEAPVIPKVVLPPLEKKVAPPEVKVEAAVGVEDEDARVLLARGKALLEQLEFGKAAELFKEAARKRVGSAVKAEASNWARKADAFELATRHISVSSFASAEVSYIIQMNDGTEMQGLKRSESDTEFVLSRVPPENPATTGQTIFPLPKSEIAKTVEVPLERRRQDFLQILGQLEANASIQRSTDYYDLVCVSKRLGTARECVAYLNRAYNGGPGHDPDPYLGDSFRKERIRRTIDQCSLMLASGRAKHFVIAELSKLLKALPGYAVAQDEVEAFKIQVLSKVKDDFRSTLKEVRKVEVAAAQKKVEPRLQTAKQMATAGEQIEQIEFVVESGGVQGNGAAAPLVAQANVKYEEGMKLYRGFKLGTNKNNNQTLKAAMVSLESAVALYDEALRKDPANKAVLDRQTEANMIVYACKKYQTL